MPLRETVSWVLQLEGDLRAEADKTAASVAKLGLSAKETKAEIARLKAEQKEAAEQSKAMSQNLLGLGAVVGATAVGMMAAVSAASRWVSATVEANKRLKEMGIETGAAGKSVDAYSTAVDGLTTSVDKLMVSVSGPGFERLAQFANVLSRIADYASRSGTSVGGMAYSALSSLSPTLAAGLSVVGAGLTGYGSTGAAGTWQYGGPDYGPQVPSGFRPPTAPAVVPYQDRSAAYSYSGVRAGTPTISELGYVGSAGTTYNAGSSTGFAGTGSSAMPPPAPTSKGAGLAGAAGAISSASGGIGAIASAFGPAGMVIGAAVDLVPKLGSVFHGLTSQLEKLPMQLVRGVTSILSQLPAFLAEGVPAIVTGLATAIPQLIGALAASLPQIIKAALVDLPEALAKALWAVISGQPENGAQLNRGARATMRGGGPRSSQEAQDMAAYAVANPNQHYGSRSAQTHDTIRAIRKELGSYGSGATIDALVTA